MLSLAKAHKDYYLQKLGEITPREDYYLRGGTATGRWQGSGAEELGLEGPVSAEGLVRLFDGQHPGTGEQLGRRLRKDGVAAWDLTFSADKSVSLLWAFGDAETRRHVVESFEEATVAALSYLESVASSTRGAARRPVTNGDGNPVLDEDGTPRLRVETWPIRTTGYVGAWFTEFTSRADDPQLHTHVVVGNRVKGDDGVWRTLDGRLLYRHKLAAGYLHEAELRSRLTQRLGVRWQRVVKGMADIEGFTRAQIMAFSKRRQQLEAWRQEQGLPDTAAAREVAVLATRSPKTDRRFEELVLGWRQRAAQVGLTPKRIARVMNHSRQVTPADPTVLFESLASLDGLTAQASSFARPEVVKEIAAALPEGGSSDEVQTLADVFLQTSDVIPLLRGRDVEQSDIVEDLALVEPEWFDEAFDSVRVAGLMRRRDGTLFPGTSDRQYTTVELLGTERRVIQRALAGIGAGRWAAPQHLVEARLRRTRTLTEGQRDMVRRFATSGDAFDIGIGPAGTGKTAVMAVIAQLTAGTGTPIVGAALAARAAAGLESATGIPATTLTRLIGESKAEGGLCGGTVVVVDEAGMVGTRQLAAVSDLVEAAQGKLILVGDNRQLAEIDAGGLFRALTNRLPAVELTDNVRQRAAWERVALTELRDGSVDQAIGMYRQHKRLVVGHNRQNTMARAVGDWYRHVTATGDLTSGLLIAHTNDTVAELNSRAHTYLSASNRLHGPNIEAGERVFQAGDRILCRNNQARLGVLNGDLGTVNAVNTDHGTLTVRLDRDPETRELPCWYLDQGHVDYGYAVTAHKAQGVTTGRTFTIIDGRTDRQWAYVAMSRGRQANTLYLAAPEPGDQQCTHLTHPEPRDPLDVLSASLGRSSTQTAAIDQIVASDPPSTDIIDRVALIAARRRAERDQPQRRPPGIELAAQP